MRDPGGLDGILARIRREFEIGGHKAAAVAMAMKQAAVYLVSSLPHELARSLHFVPFTDLGTAMTAALGAVGPDPFVAILPEGGSVLPSVSA